MNIKTYSTQKKYNAKQNGELRQPKKSNKNVSRYNDDYNDAMEQLNSLSYIGNFRF
mgnify:FL=1